MTDYAFIPLTAYGVTEYAWIDEALAAQFSRYRWHVQGGYYASTPTLGLMHRFVMGIAKGDPRVVHHINEDTLDNRRENLQVTERDLHGRLPHPRRDAFTRILVTEGYRVLLPPHERQRVLADQDLAAA